jgi:hypothetical protein
MKRILEMFKSKPEILEQIAHEAIYDGICPVCRTFNEGMNRQLQAIPFDRMPTFDSWKYLDCSKCHVVYNAKLSRRNRTRQIYKKISDGPFGLELISKEVL